MNFHKFAVQFSNNMQGTTKRRLGDALSIPLSNGISKYLGCPFIQGRIKKAHFLKSFLNLKRIWLLGKYISSRELMKQDVAMWSSLMKQLNFARRDVAYSHCDADPSLA